MELIISFKQEDVKITVNGETTMKEIKEKVIKEKEVDTSPDNVKLLHTGRILENNKTVSNYEFSDGSKIYMIVNVAQYPKTSSSTPPQSQSQTNIYPGQQYQNPQGAYQQPNPGMYQNMNNSQMNAQLDVILNNPDMLDMVMQSSMPNVPEDQKPAFKEMIKKQMELMKNNPALMQQAMQMMPQAQPGAYNPNMGNYQQSPYMQQQQPPNFYMQPPNSYMQQPNPYMQQPNPYMQQNQYQRSPDMTGVDLEKAFSDQLKKLEEMGFKNKHLNLEALKKARGDISMAVSYLSVWLDME